MSSKTIYDKVQEIKEEKDTKIIPGNIKKDVTVLGVTGTYEGSGGSGEVKLFETQQAMQADPNPEEGDLAVVYREEIQSITEDSEFDSCTFPSTVTLDEAFSDSIYGSFRSTGGGWFDGMVDMSSSSFRFDGFGDTMIRVEYSSNDGITYIRTDGGEELQEFGTTIKYANSESWNSVIGNFMKISGDYFEGLFQYTLQNRDLSNFWILNLNDVIITDNSDPQYSFTDKFEYNSQNLYDIIDGFAKMSSMYTEKNINSMSIGVYRGIDGNLYSIIPSGNISPAYTSVGYFTYTDGYIGLWADGSIPIQYEYLKYDVTTGQYSKIGEFTLSEDTTSYTTSFYNYSYTRNIYKINYNALVRTASAVISCRGDGYYGDSPYTYIYDNMVVQIINYSNAQDKYICYGGNPEICGAKFRRYDGYIIATSQLDITPDYVYQKTFYGKNGIENGTLTTNVSNLFTDVNAEVYAKIQQQYDNIQPRVLTDQDKDIDRNIAIIPCKTNSTPLLDTSNVTNMHDMFNGCKSLTTIPLLDTSNVTNMSEMFGGCTSLTTIPQLNTSNVIYMRWMFSYCTSLTTIPLLDTSNVTNMNEMFSDCTSLSDESLNNILAMCKNATKITSNKTLAYIGLTQEQATICQGLSNYSAFTSAGWTTGY